MSTIHISAISSDFPQLWKVNPEVWFSQVDAFFELCNITEDEDKFLTLVANADYQILPYISDIIKNPPATNKFEAIKERIRQIFGKTEEARLIEVIRDQMHWISKPSELLKVMVNVTENRSNDSRVKNAFLNRVNDKYRDNFNADQNIDEMGALADKLCNNSEPHFIRFWK